MWKYNTPDELYHYGILGMKWGHHRSQAYYNAKKAYKKARKADRKANLKSLGNSFLTNGITSLSEHSVKSAKRYGELDKLTTKTGINRTFAKANMKRLGNKSTNKYGYNKKEFKTFVKSQTGAGLPGSSRDIKNGGAGTQLYKRLTKAKGKKYADTVLKKSGNRRFKLILGGTAITVGARIGSNYIKNHNK